MIHVLSIGSDRKLFESGSAVALRNIAYGKKIGHMPMIVFSLKSQNFTPVKLSPEVTVYPTNSMNRFLYVFDAIRIAKEIVVKEKFVRGESVVTCQDPFESGFVGWRIARHFRFPLHLQLHTDFLSPYFKTGFLQRIRIMLGKFLLPKASGVRVVSKRIVDSLKKHKIFLKNEPQVLPIRITIPEQDVSRIKPTVSPEFKFTILMVSRLEKEKRVHDALTSFKAILEVYPHTGLVIAGSGGEKTSLEKYAQDLGIASSVRFLGWVDDTAPLFASADVFLSTSEYEGYGMSVIEAGLFGVPVVTTDVGVAGEVLINGRNSYIVSVGDTMDITARIMDLITHNEKRSMLSMALREDIVNLIPSAESYTHAYVEGIVGTLKNRI